MGCIKIRVSGDCEIDFIRFYSQPLPLQIHVQPTFLNMNSSDIHIPPPQVLFKQQDWAAEDWGVDQELFVVEFFWLGKSFVGIT